MSLGQPRNHGCRISADWTYQGMRTLILENHLLRVVVLLDKGSDMIEFRYKPLDLDFLHLSSAGVRNPVRAIPSAYSRNPFIDYYSGGWNEVLPNGGPFVEYQGADFGQHAEISLLPWECAVLEDSPQRVSARLWVRALRTPFFLVKTLTMTPEQPLLEIDEVLTNEGGTPLHFMWGQHIAFGSEFLRHGARIDAPAKKFIVHEAMPGYEPRRFQPGITCDWPHVPSPQGAIVDASLIPAAGSQPAQEMAYLAELSDGWYAVTDVERQVGFGVRFDHQLYRYIWYWQQLDGAATEFPWWGRTHTTALEPWTSYPTKGLNEAIQNGSAWQIAPGEKIHTHFQAFAYQGFTQVRSVSADGEPMG